MNGSDVGTDGVARLRFMLPLAREMASSMLQRNVRVEDTDLSKSLISQLTEENFVEIQIYEVEGMGWYGDIILKDIPTGVPDVVGIPEGEPESSAIKAEERVFSILVALLAMMIRNERARMSTDIKPKDERIFLLSGHTVRVPGVMVDTLAKQFDEQAPRFSYEDTVHFLDKTIFEVCKGKPFSLDLMKAADQDLQARLLSMIALIMRYGVFEYPKAPKGAKVH